MSVSPNESTTVDPDELVHFNEFSSVWWNKSGPIKPLHSFNGVRIPFVLEGLISIGMVKKELIGSDKPLKGLVILDVGCGAGLVSEALAKLGCTVVGIDFSPKMIEVAKKHAVLDPATSNIEYLVETIEEHVKNNYEKYDAVAAFEIVEHVADPDLFLNTCVKCLKPGGSIFVTTISKTTQAWLLIIVFMEYIWRMLPIGTHSYDKFISHEDTQKILEINKCKTKDVRGFLYNVFTDTWHWVWTKACHYGLHSVKN